MSLQSTIIKQMSNIQTRTNSSSSSTNKTPSSVKMDEAMIQRAQGLCQKHVPSLSNRIGTKTFQDRGRVFIFISSKAIWYKLRVFKVDWANISVNPFSKIEFVEIKDINEDSIKCLESKDCMSIDSMSNHMEEWIENIRKEEIEEVGKISNEIYDQRFSAYQKHKEDLCEGMPVEKVIVNRATRVNGEEQYECRVHVDFHGIGFILRLVTRENLNSLTIYSKKDYKLIKSFGDKLQISKVWNQIMELKKIFVREAKIACQLHQTVTGSSMSLFSISWSPDKKKIQIVYKSTKINQYEAKLDFQQQNLKLQFRMVTDGFLKTLKFNVYCANLLQAATDLKNHLISASQIADGNDLTISGQLQIPKVSEMTFADSYHSTHKI